MGRGVFFRVFLLAAVSTRCALSARTLSLLSRKGLLAVYIFYYLVSRTFSDKNDKNQILGNNVLTASSVIIKHVYIYVYMYIYIYIYIYCRQYCFGLVGLISALLMLR